MAYLLEFPGGQRASFPIDRPELIIGRSAACALRIDGDTAEQHARLTVDGAGHVFIQDLDTHTGTLRNGNYVYGVQRLDEGDQIQIGGVTLVFRAAAPAVTPGPQRAGAAERTQMSAELPAEVRAVLAARQQQQQQQPQARAAAVPAPAPRAAGVIVGKPEPEPANFRTVQMDAIDPSALGANAAQPVTTPMKRTILGMPTPVLPAGGAPPRPAPSALPAPPPQAPSLQAPILMSPTQGLKTEPMQAVQSPPAVKPQPSPAALSLGTQPTMMAQAPPSVQSYAHEPQQYTQQHAPPPPAYAPSPQAVPKAVPIEPTVPVQPLAKPPQPYAPPKTKGAFGSFSRALAFMGQIFSLAARHKALLQPLVWDVLVTTPIMAAFTVLLFFVRSEGAYYAVLGGEAFLLYFVDYACNSITASLVYDFSTTGQATVKSALPRVRKALPGVLTFAAVSALLDVATTYARERNDFVSRIVLRILRAIWTTATYVIMPALVIEGVSFGAAFKRSKQLMDHDPTGVGAGIVAMSITSYIVAAVCFPLAWFTMRLVAHVHPAVGALAGMLIVNLYWAVSGWMKISYATCFYLWARECERTRSKDHALAPLPLRHALDAA
jgi:hypothetical protein